MLWCWDRFLKEGDALFNYMINNINNMIVENKIKYFDIIDIRYQFTDEIDKIMRKYYDDIHMKLLDWIRKELNENRLLNKQNWKPFRDFSDLTDMVLGYKIMFKYNKYYFQLVMDSLYVIDDDFINGKYNNNCSYFELAIYGWKEHNSENMQPDNRVSIPLDNIMPEYYWNRK